MGEYSKRIGEIGEQIVEDFLTMIGWNGIARNFDIPSIDPDKHGKGSHGIDGYFNYRSNLIAKSLENVLISVKYSTDKYPNAPVQKFKDYYSDLAMAIESFKKSEMRYNAVGARSDFDATFDRGIIFWINNVGGDPSPLPKLLKIEVPREYNHDGIFLVDNEKIEFIHDAILFARSTYPAQPIEFTYINSGLNADDSITKSGPVMPVQYLASSILPMKIQAGERLKCLIICSKEKFENLELIKLIGLAKNMTSDFQAETIIAFPDYNPIFHEQSVKTALQSFEIAPAVSVANYNLNFRNVHGEVTR